MGVSGVASGGDRSIAPSTQLADRCQLPRPCREVARHVSFEFFGAPDRGFNMLTLEPCYMQGLLLCPPKHSLYCNEQRKRNGDGTRNFRGRGQGPLQGRAFSPYHRLPQTCRIVRYPRHLYPNGDGGAAGGR